MSGFRQIAGASGYAGGADGTEGDLTGSFPSPIVRGIQTYPVDPRVPNNGDTFVFNGGEWIPTPSPSNTAALFKGVWNADTNNPDIANYPGLSDGFTWLVQVAGNTSVGGITGWLIGDYAIYSGGNWYKLSNSSFGWGLTGNAGTIPSVNYVGTSDDHDLSIRANALESLRVLWTGGVVVTGSLRVTQGPVQALEGISGSLTRLNDGTSAFIGDTGVLITSASNGAVTFKVDDSKFASLTGSVFSGPVSFLAGLSGSLTQLTDGTSAFIADTGILITSSSNGAITFKVDDSKFASLTGSIFTGPVSFTAGLSGSLTKLSDGTSYLIASSNISITSASNGSVTVTALPSGLNTQVQFNDGGYFSANAGMTYNKVSNDLTLAGNVAANGGSITTSAATGNLFNANATTVNIAGGATSAVNVGNIAATNTVYGTTKFPQGLSGSLTTLSDGTSYLRASTGMIIQSSSNGPVTLSVNDSIFAALTGSTFSGVVNFNAGLSGSLTNLTDGTSYILGATNTRVTTGSNGSITVSTPAAGLDTQVQFNDGGTLFGANAGLTYNKATNSLTISGNEAVNGGNITTTAAAGNLFNTNATTVNIAGGATSAVNIGNTAATNTFSGATKFPQGLSGSLTQLTDGTSYMIAGNNIAITSASNGPVTVAFSTSVASTGNILQYNGTTWAPSNVIDTLQVSYQTVRAQGNIAAGDVCYIVNAGGSNPYPTVAKAQANSLATCKGVIGLATGSIAANTLGTVQTYGQLPGPVTTNIFAQGAPLYVSPTVAGAVTDVKPSGPNIAFQVGFVTRQGQPQNVTTGIVFVSPMQETSTQNINDLVLTTQAEHDVLTYEAATLQWKNKQSLWRPNTQVAFTVGAAPNNIITVAGFSNVVYLPINTQGGANVTLNATTPIASLTKTAVDYGRELWLHNLDNNRSISIPSGGNVKLETAALVGGNLVLAPNTLVKFIWTGIGGNGSWVQTSKALIVA